MNNYVVTFEVFDNGTAESPFGTSIKKITVEAGNKKLAAVRAMSEINKIAGYSGLYKNIISVEVEKDG